VRFTALVELTRNYPIVFVSDAYEGAISDKEIFIQSKLVELLQPGDMIMADRGFLIKDYLMDYNVSLNMPPFLHGRTRLTPQEEKAAKRTARVRIHVERAIERVRKFKILQHVFPLSQRRLVSQITFVVSCLVNYQEPLVH
jgi:DDE superfamily endonuclease